MKTTRDIRLLSIRERAIRNAMAVNNVLTREYLENLDLFALLCFVHPIERDSLLLALKESTRNEKPIDL
jgi:hypothetical protein